MDAMASASTPAASKPSIAVLAFRNLSGDPEREYFVDGVVEDIITTLSRIPSLVVIARNSSYAYKGRSVDVRQVGTELGASYVVDGSIRIAESKLRISCVLIDAATGKHIWAEHYDAAMEDIFDLQDRITARIAATIYPKIQRAEIARAQAKPTDSLSAYDLYLRAIAEIQNRTKSSLESAIELLGRAIATDQHFSAAYGFLAHAYLMLVVYGWGSVDEAKMRGFDAAKKAVELGRDDPIALSLGGLSIAYFGGRPEEGLVHIERALTLDPNYIGGWQSAGTVRCWVGDHEKCIEFHEYALQLSPKDVLAFESYSLISAAHFYLGHFDQALNWAERALRERPRFPLALVFKIAASAMDGSLSDQLRADIQQMSLRPGVSITAIMRRSIRSRSQDRELFETALRKAGFPE
jgi:adenylate cyclase